jgi:chitin-binding protein
MKLTKITLAVATLLASSAAWSHGFVYDPPSRALLCNHISNFPEVNPGQRNVNCGNIQYEPQSLEADQGYPKAGTLLDGKIASANSTRGGELDAQSMDRWVKTPISSGYNVFKWNFTAPHPATKYEYFITKNNWNPNQPLTRASFEDKPFCMVDGKGLRPGAGKSVEHTCDVPKRDGYQIILAAWTVDDTTKAFYNVLDVDFAGHNPTPPDPEPTPPKPDPEPTPPKPDPEPTPPKPDPEPPIAGGTWKSNQVYKKCDKVTYGGATWISGWWTQGDAPGSGDEWGVWRKQGSANMHHGC